MEALTLVTMHVTYPSPHDAEREEASWHQFYDIAPALQGTVDAVRTYQETPGVKIRVWYNDPEAKPELRGTHEGTMVLQ